MTNSKIVELKDKIYDLNWELKYLRTEQYRIKKQEDELQNKIANLIEELEELEEKENIGVQYVQ